MRRLTRIGAISLILFSASACSGTDGELDETDATADESALSSADLATGVPRRVFVPARGPRIITFAVSQPSDLVLAIHGADAGVRYRLITPVGMTTTPTRDVEWGARPSTGWEFARAALSLPGRYQLLLENAVPTDRERPIVLSLSDHRRSATRPRLVASEGVYRIGQAGGAEQRLIVRHASKCDGAMSRATQRETADAAREQRAVMPPLDAFCIEIPDGRLGEFSVAPAPVDLVVTAQRTRGVLAATTADGVPRQAFLTGVFAHGTPLTSVKIQHRAIGSLSLTEEIVQVTRVADLPR